MTGDGFKFHFLKELHGEDIPSGAYRVLVTIFDYTNEDGERAFPGEERLATDCRMSLRTVQRHIAWLIKAGWLMEVFRGRRNGGASVYALSYPPEKPVEAPGRYADEMTSDLSENVSAIDLDTIATLQEV